jgi:hypothetical protein
LDIDKSATLCKRLGDEIAKTIYLDTESDGERFRRVLLEVLDIFVTKVHA